MAQPSNWGALLIVTLMGMEDKRLKIPVMGKLYELAQLLENCRKQARIDVATLQKIVQYLVYLMINQAGHLDKAYGGLSATRPTVPRTQSSSGRSAAVKRKADQSVTSKRSRQSGYTHSYLGATKTA